MYYGLTNSLRGKNAGQDYNASAYIDAVVAAGATVSGTQSAAVHEFYRSAKGGGYYTSLKRLYLPIWGVAAANAIDMIGLTSGTFVGGVTHAAGYVQGNGTTGYFQGGNNNVVFSSVNNYAGLLLKTKDSRTFADYIRSGPTNDNLLLFGAGNPPTGYYGIHFNISANLSATSSNTSCVSAVRRTGNTVSTIERNATTHSVASSQTIAIVGGLSASAVNWMNKTNAQVGALFGADYLDNTLSASFTLNLKTLWEAATGLTI